MAQPKAIKNRPKPGASKGIEELLSQQTSVILKAVDERLTVHKIEMLAEMDKRLAKLELRFTEKLDRLTTTLDHFLKRMTDMEQEFTFMKHDVKRIKAVLREKLGVAID
jgi:RNase H-fold protein (predicted Holliday junction resolvase)